MPQITDTKDVCCVSLELSQSKWVCAFAPPEGAKGSLHTIKAGDHARLVEWLDRQRVRAELALGRPLQLAVCYEVGYDGFWLARILLKVGIRTVVFDPASFLKPRRGRWAKTDRLDAEEMTRILRSWLGGDSSVARDVRIPTVEEEDAKRLCRERKTLVNDRTRLVGQIKGLCALHGIMVPGKRIGRRWVAHLDEHRTGRSAMPRARANCHACIPDELACHEYRQNCPWKFSASLTFEQPCAWHSLRLRYAQEHISNYGDSLLNRHSPDERPDPPTLKEDRSGIR